MIAWSFSALEQFRNCPKQYQEVRVLKNFRELKTDERLWGDRVHKALADALSKGVPLPEGMQVWQPTVESFRKLKGTLSVENELAIDQAFRPSGWRDWDRTWCRGIVDALWLRDDGIAIAVDWKTGKRKRGSDQLALFALLVMHNFPQIHTVRTLFVWLKTLERDREDFKREDIPRLWQLFLTDTKRMENAMQTGTWIPKTSGLCNGWCPVTSCQYQGKRRNW